MTKILDDTDAVGYHDNRAIREAAYDVCLKCMEAVIDGVQKNKVPEVDVEQYGVDQLEHFYQLAARFDITEDFKQKLAAILSNKLIFYVDARRNLDYSGNRYGVNNSGATDYRC